MALFLKTDQAITMFQLKHKTVFTNKNKLQLKIREVRQRMMAEMPTTKEAEEGISQEPRNNASSDGGDGGNACSGSTSQSVESSTVAGAWQDGTGIAGSGVPRFVQPSLPWLNEQYFGAGATSSRSQDASVKCKQISHDTDNTET